MADLYQLFRTVGARPLLLAAGLAAPLAGRAQYTPGNLVVVQVGDGTPFTTTTTATKLVEYSPAGVQQGSITLNNSDPGNKLTNTDNSPSEGMLTLSADGRYLLTTGYNAPVGTAAAATAAATVARTVARISNSRSVDISTVLTDAFSGSSSANGTIRSAASLDGTAFWVAGAGSSTGLRYAPLGNGTSTSLSTAVNSTRVVRIMGNKIYFSTGAGTPGIYLLGSTSSTGSGQTPTLLIGTGAGSSPYSFILLDRDPAVAGPDAAYIADENNGLGKWAFDGSTWTKVGTLATTNVRGLTGTLTTNGSVVLYATTRSSAGSNELITVTDTNPYTAAISSPAAVSLFKAPTNVALRGVEFAPGTAVVLPVVLTRLGASRTAAGVRLAWATASEQNSARFEVQRSFDGHTFATVASVAAAGTSQLARTYGSLDATAPPTALYYRLRQVDADGRVAYSPVVPVGASPAAPLLAPNPAHDYLHLTAARPTAYTVRSGLGQAVLSGTVASGPVQLAVASLPAGVYFLELRTAESRTVQRFVKD